MRGLYMVVFLSALLPATRAAEPTPPSVTRSQNGPVLTSPVVVGVNETTSIWCRARTMRIRTLRGLFWQYSNNTRLPIVVNGESSDLDVYAEPYTGRIVARAGTWLRALHFRRAQPSSAGNYTCVADYYDLFPESVEIEIRVTDIDCGDPGIPRNGQRLSPISTLYTSRVTYSCFTGYTLQGSNHITCQSDGQWSGSVPQCIANSAINCGDPGTPTNGQLSLSRTTPGHAVTYTCDVGYTLQGSTSRICQSNGLWSGSIPQCIAIDCGDPGTPTSGQRSLSSTTYNSVVTYTCDVGYTLQGSNSRTCQSNGQWSGSVPQCKVKGTSPTSRGTSPTNSGTSPTSSGTSPTSSGTSPTSSGTSPTSSGTSPTSSGTSPTSSGTSPTSSGTSPTSSAVDCGDPGAPTNGQRSLSSTAYNSLVTYTCDVGYTLQGSNSRTCQSNGQWSGSVPQCRFITSIKSSSPLTITLSWDTKARSGTSFTVWYSTDGHEGDPTSPPQGALMVSVLNSTSVTITLPDSDDSCKPYYVWIAGITPNGKQSPYSKRRQVEVCKAGVGQSISAAESTGATVAGSFLGGVVAGGAVAILVVGILCGSWKLKHLNGKSCKGNSEEEKANPYDTVGLTESTAMSGHVAMETNPAYGVCSTKQ